MSTSWRETVLALADPDSVLIEGFAPGSDRGYVVKLLIVGAQFRIARDSPENAMRGLAYGLADVRLQQSLEAAGWTDIDSVVDENRYVVARDLNGTIWAIGIAHDQNRKESIELDMRRDALAQRIAFVDPLDTATPHALLTALEGYRIEAE